MSSQIGLSSVADDRKARLAKLKNLKRKQPADEIAAPESEHAPSPATQDIDVSQKHTSGRNYDPETRGPKLGFEAPPTLGLEKPTLEEQAAQVESDIKQQAAEESKDDQGVDLFKLQPKKPNWDLKRDLDKKMAVLNVRTDNAIARLVRARITGAQKADEGSANGKVDLGAAGMDGIALVEGLRVRQQEEEDEERREREEHEAMLA